MSEKQTDNEVALDEALAELEAASQPTGGMIAKALAGLVTLVKGSQKPKAKPQDKKLQDLLEQYDLDDDDEEEDEDAEDQDEDEDEDEDEDDEDLQDEDEDDYVPPTKRKAVRKSLDFGPDDDFDLVPDAIVDTQEFTKSLVSGLRGTVEDAIARRTAPELRRLRKALVAVAQKNEELQKQIEELGYRPAGAPGNYSIRKGLDAGGEGVISKETLAKADEALSKGLISPADRRILDIANQTGDANCAAFVLAKLR